MYRSSSGDTNLLLKALSPSQSFNLSLGANEGSLIVILLVRASKDALSGLLSLESFLLQGSVVGVVETRGWDGELVGIPILKRTDQLLLDRIDLTLALSKLNLAVLELAEVVAIDLLEVLHLAKHDEFLLIDDLLSLFLKHVIRAELFVT